MKGLRKKEDPWNSIIAGFFTGGSLAIRGGYKAARNGAIGCAVLLAVIEGVGIGFQRMVAGSTKLEVRRPCSVGVAAMLTAPSVSRPRHLPRNSRLHKIVRMSDRLSSLPHLNSSPPALAGRARMCIFGVHSRRSAYMGGGVPCNIRHWLVTLAMDGGRAWELWSPPERRHPSLQQNNISLWTFIESNTAAKVALAHLHMSSTTNHQHHQG